MGGMLLQPVVVREIMLIRGSSGRSPCPPSGWDLRYLCLVAEAGSFLTSLVGLVGGGGH